MFTPGSLPQQYFEQLTYLLSSSFFDLNLNRERMQVYTSQANFALSRKNLAHLVQTIVFDEFAKFDYGVEENQNIYGKMDPPEYDIAAITNRTVGLIYSANDEWASVQDFESIGQRMRGKFIFLRNIIVQIKIIIFIFSFIQVWKHMTCEMTILRNFLRLGFSRKSNYWEKEERVKTIFFYVLLFPQIYNNKYQCQWPRFNFFSVSLTFTVCIWWTQGTHFLIVSVSVI